MVTQPFRLWHLQRELRFHLPPLQTSDRARSLTPEAHLSRNYVENNSKCESSVMEDYVTENEKMTLK